MMQILCHSKQIHINIQTNLYKAFLKYFINDKIHVICIQLYFIV